MSDNPSPRRIDPSIIAALIGVLGTITVTLISIFANRQPATQTPTNTPAQIVISTNTLAATAAPTDTVPPNEPTSTPAPTDTPAPTFTFTPIPPVGLGEDWPAGCISSAWMVYPAAETSAANGCLNLPVDKFYTTNGRLAFVYSDVVQSAEIHGIFAKLPNSGKLSLNMKLDEVANGEILVGVFGGPTIDSNGALLVVPASNNPDKTKMLLKTMPGQKPFAGSDGPVNSKAGGEYDLYFEFDSGQVTVKLQNGQINLGTVPALSAERWLFIGYQVFIGANRLNAEFSNLVIVQ